MKTTDEMYFVYERCTLTHWREYKAYLLKLLLNYSFKKYVLYYVRDICICVYLTIRVLCSCTFATLPNKLVYRIRRVYIYVDQASYITTLEQGRFFPNT